ncbi:MAG: CHAT domain-containing protein, partial [Bacteroidota bacterium]
SSLQARWQKLLFARENEYRRLSESLELAYPSYYQEKYSLQDWKIKDIQASLNARQQLIEYFWGEKQLFIFKITAQSVQLESVAIDPSLPQALQRVQRFVSKPNASEQAYQQYQEDSYFLYEQLVGNVDARYDELIIIPDGPLGYLPFDALLTSAVKEADKLRYHELPYLLQQYRLYYQYSAALLLQAATKSRGAKLAYGGFAPSYPALPNAQRGVQMVLNQDLSQLVFTKEEVSNTQSIWGGKAYLDEAATKEIFLQEAADYKLLHLAMHGLLSGENTEFAALAFHPSSDSAGEFLLSMEEIAAMELSADLVVLSACETGAGRLRRGEGIISMARAFREAGCPNILMSLWTADDKSSTLIMQDFFGRLKSGDKIAEAIRAAKLELMSTQLLQSHPYYWAGFVPLGNPNDRKSNSHLLLIGLMLLMGVGLGFMAYRKAEV